MPYGLDSIEYDREGYVAGYWYKPINEPELRHVGVARWSELLPKELEFGWYIAKTYLIEPNSNSSQTPRDVPPEITASLGDSNEFLLTILKKMQTELEGKSA